MMVTTKIFFISTKLYKTDGENEEIKRHQAKKRRQQNNIEKLE